MSILFDHPTILYFGILLPAMMILVVSQWIRYNNTEKVAVEMIAEITMTTKQSISNFFFYLIIGFLILYSFPFTFRMSRHTDFGGLSYLIISIITAVMLAFTFNRKQKICTRGILNAQGLYVWNNIRTVKISDKQSDVILVFLYEPISRETCIKLKCIPEEIERYVQIIENQMQKEAIQ